MRSARSKSGSIRTWGELRAGSGTEFVAGVVEQRSDAVEGSGARDRDLAMLVVGGSVVEVSPAERCGAGRRCDPVARASTGTPTDR